MILHIELLRCSQKFFRGVWYVCIILSGWSSYGEAVSLRTVMISCSPCRPTSIKGARLSFPQFLFAMQCCSACRADLQNHPAHTYASKFQIAQLKMQYFQYTLGLNLERIINLRKLFVQSGCLLCWVLGFLYALVVFIGQAMINLCQIVIATNFWLYHMPVFLM